MSDNVEITEGTGAIIAADEVTRNAISEKQQIVKIGLGADGVHDGLVSEGTPLPVRQSIGIESVYATLAVVAFGSVGASFSLLLTPDANSKRIDIYNDTDAAIRISFDGGSTEHAFCPAKCGRTFSLGDLGLCESDTVHIKRDSGAPTVGNVYGEACS